MSITTYLKEYNGEPIEWVEKPTCYISTAAQCTPLWDALHIGSVSSSKLTTWLGRTKYYEGLSESVLQCIGESHKKFDSASLDAATYGIIGEPIVRNWYSSVIDKKIEEVGIAVWKRDPRFRASLDGIYYDDSNMYYGIEIKVPKFLYKKLSHYYKSRQMHNNNHPPYGHICEAHYNQMIQSIAITGVEYIDYIVSGYSDNKTYIEKIYPDNELWEKTLYPMGVKFLEEHVEPMMLQKSIKRIDPWVMLNGPTVFKKYQVD